MLIIISFSSLLKIKYPKHYKQNAYALAHEMSRVCFDNFLTLCKSFNVGYSIKIAEISTFVPKQKATRFMWGFF